MSRSSNRDERPYRTLFVRNINYTTSEREVRDTFSQFGEIKDICSQINSKGIVFVTFYDVRDAKRAKETLQRTLLNDRAMDIHFSIPKDRKPEDIEVSKFLDDSLFITLCNSSAELTVDDVRGLFSTFGPIKGIRQWAKKDQKIVQFYDSRDCEKAKREMQNYTWRGGQLEIKFALANTKEEKKKGKRAPGPDRNTRDRSRNSSTPYERNDSSRRNTSRSSIHHPTETGLDTLIQHIDSSLQKVDSVGHSNIPDPYHTPISEGPLLYNSDYSVPPYPPSMQQHGYNTPPPTNPNPYYPPPVTQQQYNPPPVSYNVPPPPYYQEQYPTPKVPYSNDPPYPGTSNTPYSYGTSNPHYSHPSYPTSHPDPQLKDIQDQINLIIQRHQGIQEPTPPVSNMTQYSYPQQPEYPPNNYPLPPPPSNNNAPYNPTPQYYDPPPPSNEYDPARPRGY